ncbi:MAG TPA: hypothetical protein VK681_39215 [Reyranella sp.]|nr:hypothetical protein [Reyranella sp.]
MKLSEVRDLCEVVITREVEIADHQASDPAVKEWVERFFRGDFLEPPPEPHR